MPLGCCFSPGSAGPTWWRSAASTCATAGCTFTQTKNQRNKPVTLSIPVIAELKELIDATPSDHLTFLTTEFGKSFTSNGFGNRFRKWCDDAGLKHCSAHGLRKAGAAIAAENNGATETQLMAVFGWKTMKEAERGTRAGASKSARRNRDAAARYRTAKLE